MNISSLKQDLTITNDVNTFRQNHNLRPVNSPYPWYVPMMAALTYYKCMCVTRREIVSDLETLSGIVTSACADNFKKLVMRQERDRARRNYAIKLPGLAEACGLCLGGKVHSSTGGHPADTFYVNDRKHARQVILAVWPNTDILFAHLDNTFKV